MKNSIIWALALFPAFVFAQKQNDGQELIDNFFQVYESKGPSAAMLYAFKTSSWVAADGDKENDEEELSPLSPKLAKATAHMGKFLGQEEIKSRNIGSRYRIASHLVYYERQPIRMTFSLYKNNNGWEIIDVSFDTKFVKELAETVNLNF